MAENCPVLLLHNGMGTLGELKGLRQPLLRGITTHAAMRDGTVIKHVASGVTHIGPANRKSEGWSAIADVLHDALPTSHGMTISGPPAGANWRLTA